MAKTPKRFAPGCCYITDYRDRAACGPRRTFSNLGSRSEDTGQSPNRCDFDVEMAPSVDRMQFEKGRAVKVQFEITHYLGGFLSLQVATPRPPMTRASGLSNEAIADDV